VARKRRKWDTDGNALVKDERETGQYLVLIIVTVFFRLVISLFEPYRIDMNGYLAWSRFLAESGPADLYSRYHVVYAPFYLYFLWITGHIAKFLGLAPYLHILMIKLWAVLSDFLGAYIIYRMSERSGRRDIGSLAAIFYILNPGVLMNSSIWGQFDSIPATMLLGAIYLFDLGKRNIAALLFLVSVLTKPQSGLLAPMVLYLYFKGFRFDKKNVGKMALAITAGIGLYLAIVLPFYKPTKLCGTKVPAFLDPFWWLFDLYSRSIEDYPFATANGFNFWTLVGGQIREDTLPFMGLTFQLWGNILFLLSAVYVFYLLYKGKGSTRAIVYCSYLMLFSAFVWITRMHERYLLPAIIFIVLAAAFDRSHIPAALLTSICVFANQVVVYAFSFQKIYWLPRWYAPAIVIAAATMATYALAMVNGYRWLAKESPGQGIDINKRERFILP